MTSLIERLREDARLLGISPGFPTISAECVEAADRIEELERQLATRAVTATKIALEVAARVAEQLPSNTGMYLDRREVAAAIRTLSESAPFPLQEQRDNISKEGE